MVGYRNRRSLLHHLQPEFIRHSDGGVSEQAHGQPRGLPGVYQAFRWWGIGTSGSRTSPRRRSLSGIPMVGYRNVSGFHDLAEVEFIRHSDGGVSEPIRLNIRAGTGVYQAFRWWGIGTFEMFKTAAEQSLSGIPMVGYRNTCEGLRATNREFIRHSDGGVSEPCGGV